MFLKAEVEGVLGQGCCKVWIFDTGGHKAWLPSQNQNKRKEDKNSFFLFLCSQPYLFSHITMTQSIVVQVGQCGNQIGCRFWDLALREYASYNKLGNFDESLSSFFRNVEPKSGREIPVGNGTEKIRGLRARSILVDMEEGVVNDIISGPLRELFDVKQLVTDVSGEHEFNQSVRLPTSVLVLSLSCQYL